MAFDQVAFFIFHVVFWFCFEHCQWILCIQTTTVRVMMMNSGKAKWFWVQGLLDVKTSA